MTSSTKTRRAPGLRAAAKNHLRMVGHQEMKFKAGLITTAYEGSQVERAEARARENPEVPRLSSENLAILEELGVTSAITDLEKHILIVLNTNRDYLIFSERHYIMKDELGGAMCCLCRKVVTIEHLASKEHRERREENALITHVMGFRESPAFQLRFTQGKRTMGYSGPLFQNLLCQY